MAPCYALVVFTQSHACLGTTVFILCLLLSYRTTPSSFSMDFSIARLIRFFINLDVRAFCFQLVFLFENLYLHPSAYYLVGAFVYFLTPPVVTRHSTLFSPSQFNVRRYFWLLFLPTWYPFCLVLSIEIFIRCSLVCQSLLGGRVHTMLVVCPLPCFCTS